MLSTLFKRSSVYFTGLTVSKGLSTLVFILFARQLLPQKFGQYIFFVTMIQVITYFADAGLNQWYQKHYEATEDKKSVIHLVLNARFFTLGVSIIVAALVILLLHPFSIALSLVFILMLIPEALTSIMDGYYLKAGKPLQVSLKNSSKMLVLLAGYLIFRRIFSVDIALYLYVLASSITMLWYFPWKTISRFELISVKKNLVTLTSSFPYAFLILTSFLYSRGDFIIIRMRLGSAALGLYDSAYRYLESISLLPTALSHNLFPISSRKEGITTSQLLKITAVMSFIGIFVAVAVIFTSNFLITFLLGNAYAAAVPVLKILALVILLFFINAPLSTVIQSSNLVKKFLPFGFGNTAINIILNFIFVPLYGIQTAAWIMLLTEVSGFVINLAFIKRIYRKS